MTVRSDSFMLLPMKLHVLRPVLLSFACSACVLADLPGAGAAVD